MRVFENAPGQKSPRATDQRVPHISLVFCEMWETRTSTGSLLRDVRFLWLTRNSSRFPNRYCHPDRSAAKWRDLRFFSEPLGDNRETSSGGPFKPSFARPAARPGLPWGLGGLEPWGGLPGTKRVLFQQEKIPWMLRFGFVSGHDFSRAAQAQQRSGLYSPWGTSFPIVHGEPLSAGTAFAENKTALRVYRDQSRHGRDD